LRRIFVLSSGLLALYHSTDALGAESLLNFLAVFDNSDLLQIWFESTPGSSQRETAVMTESRRFSTGIALCHFNFLSLRLLQN
jgi:CRP-like cAMP-binding protein